MGLVNVPIDFYLVYSMLAERFHSEGKVHLKELLVVSARHDLFQGLSIMLHISSNPVSVCDDAGTALLEKWIHKC